MSTGENTTSRTTPSGTTITADWGPGTSDTQAFLYAQGEKELGKQEIGRIVGWAFQPAFLSAIAHGPGSLRVIAELIEAGDEG